MMYTANSRKLQSCLNIYEIFIVDVLTYVPAMQKSFHIISLLPISLQYTQLI